MGWVGDFLLGGGIVLGVLSLLTWAVAALCGYDERRELAGRGGVIPEWRGETGDLRLKAVVGPAVLGVRKAKVVGKVRRG